MATTQLALASRVQKWNSDFFEEYIADSPYLPFMGDQNSMMPIVARYELASGGKTVNLPLIAALKGQGVQGLTTLEGNEEALANYNKQITVNWNRNAVKVMKPDESWTEMDLRRAAKSALKKWAAEALRDDITSAFISLSDVSILKGNLASIDTTDGRTPLEFYNSYSEAAKDAWLAANSDRFLFGAAVSNHSSNDHSAALLNIDTTNDRLSSSMVSLAKQVARESNPLITPFKTDSTAGRDWFIMFVNSRGFRDLKRDSAIVQANRDARPRDVSSNPLFNDGDLLWDGVIIREVPTIPTLVGVGASTSDVGFGFLCGAQSVGLAWGQKPKSVVSTNTDYGFQYRVGIEECRATSKMIFNGKQHGMVSVYYSAPATA